MSRKSPQLTRRQVLKNGVSSAAVVAASATVLGNRPLSAASYSRILGSNAGLRGATKRGGPPQRVRPCLRQPPTPMGLPIPIRGTALPTRRG